MAQAAAERPGSLQPLGGVGVAVAQLAACSNHLNVRDKTVKALQYTCRMLVGHYGSRFTAQQVAVMRNVSFLCSMGRKLFRLGKSVTCLNDLIKKLSPANNLLSSERPPRTVREVAFCLELLEHVFMSMFILYDHVLFLGRAQLLTSYDARLWESRNYGVWLLHDAARLCRSTLLLTNCSLELSRLPPSDSATDAGDAEGLVAARRAELQRRIRQLVWDVCKSCCDVGVSGGMFATTVSGKAAMRRWAPPSWRHGVLQDGTIGLLGAVSAVMSAADSAAECYSL